jgi:hypothetical protein
MYYLLIVIFFFHIIPCRYPDENVSIIFAALYFNIYRFLSKQDPSKDLIQPYRKII